MIRDRKYFYCDGTFGSLSRNPCLKNTVFEGFVYKNVRNS
jgi:hypothetical protein